MTAFKLSGLPTRETFQAVYLQFLLSKNNILSTDIVDLLFLTEIRFSWCKRSIFAKNVFLHRGPSEVVSHYRKYAFLTFFIDAFIFSDRCLKNHKIFHLLSTFLEILRKFSANQDQHFLLVVFF